MKIHWVGPGVQGTFHNNPLGIKSGHVIDTADYEFGEDGLQGYLDAGWAVKVPQKAPEVESVSEPPFIGGGTNLGGNVKGEPHFPDKEWVDELPEAKRPPSELEKVELEPAVVLEPEKVDPEMIELELKPEKPQPPRVPVKRTPRSRK